MWHDRDSYLGSRSQKRMRSEGLTTCSDSEMSQRSEGRVILTSTPKMHFRNLASESNLLRVLAVVVGLGGRRGWTKDEVALKGWTGWTSLDFQDVDGLWMGCCLNEDRMWTAM
jgi:hypothetical protein